jgi:DNA-binding CsgD family transcriptional regulator
MLRRMATSAPAVQLFGRQREREVLDRVLDAARDGRGGVLAVYGEPGVGKTALLDYAVEIAPDFHVARAVGVEGEMEFAFAAVQQLCSPSLDLLERLPVPQREAFEVAFGLSRGPAPDLFLVGLAVLNLLSEAAKERPLLCVVDDAQWLDRASARVLAFVARRLLAERIAMVFAAREPVGSLAGLAELHVEPLGRRDARALLDSVLPGRLDERVLERIVVETRGNPLALLELPRGLSPAQLAGGFGLAAASPVSAVIEQSFTRRLARLPRDSRQLLLLAAAEPLGDPAVLWRAARQLGIPETAADAVEGQGLLTLDGAVTFRHPLVRSAIYSAAEPGERRLVHLALAEATDSKNDPDRRAWHRAQAASTPDEDLAAELERSAARAQARGGLSAAAAFLERATALTPEESQRSGRALAAAEAKLRAGALDDAGSLVATAESGPLTDLEQARATLLRGQISFLSTRASEATLLLLDAAERLRDVEPELARETYLEAVTAAIFAGPLAAPGASSPAVARVAKEAPPARKPRALDLLLDGLVAVLTDTYAAAVPTLQKTQRAFGNRMSQAEQLRWMWGGTISAMLLWDDARWERLSVRHLQLVRQIGALGDLPIALSHRGQMHVFAGELASAESLHVAIEEATQFTGGHLAPYHGVGLMAMRGREADARRFIDKARSEVAERGEGAGLEFIDWAEAVLYNGLGRYAEALEASRRVLDEAELVPVGWAMPELIEAAVRTGALDLAAETNRLLSERTSASATDWALGIAARSQALLAEHPSADELYREAIERLSHTRVAVDLARARLLYGEWLRRERRRTAARTELRAAHEFFSDSGVEGFAERARVELEATGEHARKRSVDTLGDLTPQEVQVSRLVAQGQTNREIAAQLFISPSTVEYHLRKVFRKLGVKSRTQLASRML